MFANRELTIKGLIESKDGLHLTGYLVNRDGDLSSLKEQLLNVRNEAYEFLAPVLPKQERMHFLAPIDQLLQDATVLQRMKGNIAIFRKKNAFRVLSLPVEVEPGCIVATSFHVKPLLRWNQVDQAFLLLGLNESGAHLYFGSQQSLTKVGSLLFHQAFESLTGNIPISHQEKNQSLLEAMAPVHDWLAELTRKSRPKLFLAGNQFLTRGFIKEAKYRNLLRAPILDSFDESRLPSITDTARQMIKQEVSRKIKKAFFEFHVAEEMNLTSKNIFQIAKAAARGRIRKLIVADGIRIFGKIDRKTGEVQINPYDLDHEDDDILDDLAQSVLAEGGEVIVADREEIPKGYPALAIMSRNDRENLRPNQKLNGTTGRIKEAWL